ncbi:MAG: DUF1559 domain-containing protein [Candidatus Omnitrophica bacterium]|nr:DUF1559 domain-containing protein [Candidatus Omnitrophota bacterium]MBU4488284.1 DUF1559 domain-containing protein [Candidatus Omnitrophota bacterium]MCG2704500.1 DUF1559 domain-containing protein [Candidatus Omnitrophota bacterium]
MIKKSLGFTLIELLVVLVIVGLLIAIILPAVRGAMDSAKTAVCMNNLRQIYLGMQMYADDHDGNNIPSWPGPSGPGVTSTTSGYIWANNMKYGLGNLYPDYIDDINIFFCPSNNKKLGDIFDDDPPSDFGVSGKKVPCSYWTTFYLTDGVFNTMEQSKDKLIVWDKNIKGTFNGPHRRKSNNLYGNGSIKLE